MKEMASAYLPDRELSQGSTYVDEISIFDQNGNPIFFGDGQAGSGSGDLFGSGEEGAVQYYEALFQIREDFVDTGAPALITLTDIDAVVLGDGLITITLSATQTEEIVSATSARVLWAELDLQHFPSEEVNTYRWKLQVRREYARSGS
jgi:hypothetical protein